MTQTFNRAFYTLHRELRILAASPNTLRIWGKSSRELVGKKLVEVFPFVEGSAVHTALDEALRSFRPARLQTNSVVLGKPVDVEIYPVREGLQVGFGPVD